MLKIIREEILSFVKENMEFNPEKTGMPYYDDMLRLPDYFRENKDKIFTIEWMSPTEYLNKARQGFMQIKGYSGSGWSGIDSSSQEKLKDAVAQGEKIHMPVLDYSGNYFTQEGRNRAFLANQLGVEKIPVMIIRATDG